jgi:hypothetical protein
VGTDPERGTPSGSGQDVPSEVVVSARSGVAMDPAAGSRDDGDDGVRVGDTADVTPSAPSPEGRALAAVGSPPLPDEGWSSVVTPGGSAGIGASLRHLVADLYCG